MWGQEPFTRVFDLGMSDYGRVWVTVKWNGTRLSLIGVEGPRKDGNAKGSYGQIVASLREDIRNGWTREAIDRLAEIWERWHLNDMRAGCEHQRAAGWSARDMVGVTCEVCGYKFGTAWLTEEVPVAILEELHDMPAATREHPWGDATREGKG